MTTAIQHLDQVLGWINRLPKTVPGASIYGMRLRTAIEQLNTERPGLASPTRVDLVIKPCFVHVQRPDGTPDLAEQHRVWASVNGSYTAIYGPDELTACERHIEVLRIALSGLVTPA